jgi:hypothetical protein
VQSFATGRLRPAIQLYFGEEIPKTQSYLIDPSAWSTTSDLNEAQQPRKIVDPDAHFAFALLKAKLMHARRHGGCTVLCSSSH